MKIVLVNSPIRDCDHIVYNKIPPLGLLYIASYIRTQHSDCSIAILDLFSKGIKLKECLKIIKQETADIVGFNVFDANVHLVSKMISLLKKDNPKIIFVVGGPFVTLFPDQSLSITDADHAIVGQGEDAFNALLGEIMSESCTQNIYYGNQYNTNADYIDSLPFPAFDLINLDEYSVDTSRKGFILTARGCPSQCIFCCSPKMYSGKFWARNICKVNEEIETQIDTLKIKELHFIDDTLTVSNRRIHKICDCLKGYEITWRALSRADIPEDILQTMSDSGCNKLSFGIETGSTKVMEKISKQISLNHVEALLKTSRDIGITTKAFFMLGFPFEGPEDILSTINFAVNISKKYGTECVFNIVKIYNGTKLASMYPDKCESIVLTSNNDSFNSSLYSLFSKYCDLPKISINPYFSTEELLKIAGLAYHSTISQKTVSMNKLLSIASYAGEIDNILTEDKICEYIQPIY